MGSEYQEEERERERKEAEQWGKREGTGEDQYAGGGEWMNTVVVNLCKRWKTRVGEGERRGRALSSFHWK
jgi:hypothetical protein